MDGEHPRAAKLARFKSTGLNPVELAELFRVAPGILAAALPVGPMKLVGWSAAVRGTRNSHPANEWEGWGCVAVAAGSTLVRLTDERRFLAMVWVTAGGQGEAPPVSAFLDHGAELVVVDRALDRVEGL